MWEGTGALPEVVNGADYVAWFDAQILYAGFSNRQSAARISLVNMLAISEIKFDRNGWHDAGNDAQVR